LCFFRLAHTAFAILRSSSSLFSHTHTRAANRYEFWHFPAGEYTHLFATSILFRGRAHFFDGCAKIMQRRFVTNEIPPKKARFGKKRVCGHSLELELESMVARYYRRFQKCATIDNSLWIQRLLSLLWIVNFQYFQLKNHWKKFK